MKLLGTIRGPRSISPRWLVLLAAALAAALMNSATPLAQVPGVDLQPPQACTDPSESQTLFAERLGKKRIAYGLTPETASIPGPTLEMTEGDCLFVTLVNDTNVSLSMHAHGVHYTTQSDGTALNKSCVAPGKSRTYVFNAPAPSPRADGSMNVGTAGYWHYHDHCVGTPHGTGGIKAGLFGALIVRRAGDPVPARDPYVVVFGPGSRINLKRAPNTPVLEANEGERVEFVVITHGEDFHTFHLHGHRWANNRMGSVSGPSDLTQLIDNRTTGPADSFGFQVIAGEGVGTGAWMYHCHVQGHSDAGMSGIFMVKTAGGLATDEGRAALRAWRKHEGHHHH